MVKASSAGVSKGHAGVLLWILAWSVCHVFNLTALKLIAADVPVVVMLFGRTLFGLFFLILPTFLTQRRWPSLRSRSSRLQFLRALLILASMSATYYGYRTFPIALGTSLGFTQPFLVSILAVFLLKEKVPLVQWGVLVVGYAGALFFANPFAHPNPFGAWILLVANILASLAVILTKRLSVDDAPQVTLFYSFSIIALVTGVGSFITWVPLALFDVGLLVLMGAFGTLSQYTFIVAMEASSASFVAPFDYLKLVAAMPLGVLVFDEHVTWHIALGGALIIGSNWYLARRGAP